MPRPTPYPKVNAVLWELLPRIRAILRDRFIGLYLYGSLALGDFDPDGSDIDLLVVTDGNLAEDLFVDLRAMHACFASSGSPWAARIEAAYVPRTALRCPAPMALRYPQVEKGAALELSHLEAGWAYQCYTLREYGVVVAGPRPRTLIERIDPAEMTRAASTIVVTWLDQARHDPSWLPWLHERANRAFVVLTLCRMLYTLDSDLVGSKPAAAHWAREALDRRWTSLIERSLAEQHVNAHAPDGDLEDVLALLAYTDKRLHERQGLPTPE